MESQAKEFRKNDSNRVIELEKGKLLPHAIDIEEAVLGAMMISMNGTHECLLILKSPEVFYKIENVSIFKSIQKLYQEGAPIDLLSVSSSLRTMGLLNSIGGDIYLIELTQKISSSAHIEFHCRILIQYYIRRKMIFDNAELSALAYDEEKDIFELMAHAERNIGSLREQTSTGVSDLSMKEGLTRIGKRIEVLTLKKSNELSGCFTGFKKLDVITNGWQNSDLIVIGARPGMGKTSLVLKTMLENIKQNIPVGFISCEMSSEQLMTRLVACNSNFDLNQLLRTGFNESIYFEEFIILKGKMEKYPAYFDDQSSDLYDVIAKIRFWHRKFGIRMAIIDYLQLMSCKLLNKNSIREQEIATITRSLKRLAKELNIPIIVLSQLGRGVDNRVDKRPLLNDLRESGAIEQDADLVAFIYRPSYYGIELDDAMLSQGANTEFIIAKHRNGSIDRKGLFFDESKTKFTDPQDNYESY